MITSKELREKWIKFYESKGHVNIGAVSLIGDGTTGVMFNVAGMQPLMPYLLGKKHPMGTRLCNVQGCVRTVDIDSVGDATHFTFFEMMGNWSLGDYFKKEKTAWTFELLTEVFGFDKDKICSTVFEGNDAVPRDEETAELLKSLGIKEENIFFLPKKDNWWELEGTVGTPCGPDNEWFYPRTDLDKDSSDFTTSNRYVEIGNDVYMQYEKLEGGKYKELANKNVDTGFGLDRLLLFLNGLDDGYKTDLFIDSINYLEKVSGRSYDSDEQARKAMRIIADHMRTSVMLIGDVNGITPSNTGAGYILRRLLRRAIRYCKNIGLETVELSAVAKIFIEKIYDTAYPLLVEKKDYILEEIQKECKKFEATLASGMKEFEKAIIGMERKNAFMSQKDANYIPETEISGKQAFRLYDTFGFPLELTEELALEKGLTVDKNGFDEAFRHHQEISKAQASAKGGLTERNEATIKYHTATHVMLAGLRKMFGDKTEQKGSNITEERLRFDFNCDHKMTEEELKTLENFVNDVIAKKIPVVKSELPYNQAISEGAYGVFNPTSDDELVTIYTIEGVDKQICGGPHVENTGDLGTFKIKKEESSSSGVRRIKAVLS